MQQAGLIEKMNKKYSPKYDKCDNSLLKAKPMTLYDISGALSVLGIGITLAMVALFAEYLY